MSGRAAAVIARGWPHPQASRFVSAGGLVWHVQQFGEGPGLLLLHGTGSASLSWRAVAPLLAARFRVIAPDLPGHGLTEMPAFGRLSLPAIAQGVADLLRRLQMRPLLAAGHSAGAAVLVHMALERALEPRVLVGINGALLPWRGLPRLLFAPAARLIARRPLVWHLTAQRAAAPGSIERLIASTGSHLDAEGVRLYRMLGSDPGHVCGALGMMANWDLTLIERRLRSLAVPLTLLVGSRDLTVSPSQAWQVQTLLPAARVLSLGPLGHLAHEEQPQRVADLLLGLAGEAGAPAG